jgi:hypothetical protein
MKMMEMTSDEMRFLTRRRRLVRAWPLVGAFLLCLVTGLGVWLFLTRPLLANPFAVLSMLRTDSIPASTLALMASLLPVAVLTCIVLVLAIVFFAFASFVNEKKYLTMIQRIADRTVLCDPGRSKRVDIVR